MRNQFLYDFSGELRSLIWYSSPVKKKIYLKNIENKLQKSLDLHCLNLILQCCIWFHFIWIVHFRHSAYYTLQVHVN